eukprot:6871008-Prymnesium_polylepis.1
MVAICGHVVRSLSFPKSRECGAVCASCWSSPSFGCSGATWTSSASQKKRPNVVFLGSGCACLPRGLSRAHPVQSTGKTGLDRAKQKAAQQLIGMMHGLNGVFHPTVLYPMGHLQGFGAMSSGGAPQTKRARGTGRWTAKQQEAEKQLANCSPASTPAFVLQPGLGAPQVRQNVTFPGQSNEL